MTRRDLPHGLSAAGVGVVLMTTALLVAGCSGAPHPPETSTATAPSRSASATAPPAPPAVLVPEGTAAQNLPLFTSVVESVWNSAGKVTGRAYVDALVAAGFDKSEMQVTADASTVGNAAESIQFSVRWNDGRCLIGQVGPATGDPVATVLPGLADGKCLLGKTRPIDW